MALGLGIVYVAAALIYAGVKDKSFTRLLLGRDEQGSDGTLADTGGASSSGSQGSATPPFGTSQVPAAPSGLTSGASYGNLPLEAGKEINAISYARQLGLHVGENPYVGAVTPGVHVGGSYHYQTFPQTYGGKRLGRAIDVTGSPAQLSAFFDWVRQLDPIELIYTPRGAYDRGTAYTPTGDLAAAHRTHVHVAF